MDNPNDSIGQLITAIAKQRRTYSNALLKEHGLHAGQELLLYALNTANGQTVNKLVKALAVKPATISNMVDRMEAKGLVERRKGTIDKRTARVYITEQGVAVLKEVDDALFRIEEKATKGLSVLDKFMLRRLLGRLEGNLE